MLKASKEGRRLKKTYHPSYKVLNEVKTWWQLCEEIKNQRQSSLQTQRSKILKPQTQLLLSNSSVLNRNPESSSLPFRSSMYLFLIAMDVKKWVEKHKLHDLSLSLTHTFFSYIHVHPHTEDQSKQTLSMNELAKGIRCCPTPDFTPRFWIK